MTPETDQPEGWRREPLKDAVRLIKDKVDPTSVSPETPYIGLEHVEAHSMRLLGHGRATDVKSTKSVFQAGDVLYGKLRPYLNKVVRPDFDGICSTDFLVFGESPRLDSGYLAHYLNQLWVADQAHQLSNGVELPRVNWESLSQLPLDYPPSKADQRSIVTQIQRAASLRFSAASHVAAGRRAVKQLRQAILAAACSGRLTQDLRDANGDDPEDLPASWRSVQLAELIESSFYGPRFSSDAYVADGVPTIRTTDMDERGNIQFRDPPKLELSDHELERLRLRDGDLLVTRTGATIGKCVIYEDRLGPALPSAYLIRFRLRKDQALPNFILLFLLSPLGQATLREAATATAQPNVNAKSIAQISLSLPPIDEQHEIVRRASNLLSTADALRARIDDASRAVERSSQAVLAKAFRGDLLLPQEAEIST